MRKRRDKWINIQWNKERNEHRPSWNQETPIKMKEMLQERKQQHRRNGNEASTLYMKLPWWQWQTEDADTKLSADSEKSGWQSRWYETNKLTEKQTDDSDTKLTSWQRQRPKTRLQKYQDDMEADRRRWYETNVDRDRRGGYETSKLTVTDGDTDTKLTSW